MAKAENIFVIVAYCVMVAAIFIQVINRNFIQATIGWFEKLARYCMIAVIMFSVEIAFRTNEHMRLQIILDHLPTVLRKIFEFVIRIGDEYDILKNYWANVGGKMRSMIVK